MSKSKTFWTVLPMLEWATGYFEKQGISNPRLNIEVLLAEVLGVKRLDLYLMYDRPLSADELDRLRPMVRRRGLHEPLQYITGYTRFMNCKIEVNPAVLIPRAETEQLVAMVLDEAAGYRQRPLRVLDIGTGSGCIPIALSKEMPGWHCTAIDTSGDALKQARRNAALNGVQVNFLKSDLLSLKQLPELTDKTYELIVSNPPYILPSEKKTLDKEVADFEPDRALFHENPVLLYKAIGEFASTHLSVSGALYLECSNRLIRKIKQVLETRFQGVTVRKDFDGEERFIIAEKSP